MGFFCLPQRRGGRRRFQSERFFRLGEPGWIQGYVLRTKSILWRTDNIHVCWEKESTGSEEDKELIRQAVVTDYALTETEGFGGIHFVGWSTCAREDREGIRILLGDQAAQVRALGALMAGLRNGMLLFDRMHASSCGVVGQERIVACLKSTAIHEFGHALGLRHEQERLAGSHCPDENEELKEKIDEWGIAIGPYDRESIMNYCNTEWTHLSEGDIDALRRLYGHTIPFGDDPDHAVNKRLCEKFGLGYDPSSSRCIYDADVCYLQGLTLKDDPSDKIGCVEILTEEECMKIPAKYSPQWDQEASWCMT